MTEPEARAALCEVGRRLWLRGLVASTEGNLSARLEGQRILATPSGVSKGFLTPDMLVVCDLNGQPLPGQQRRPSSEMNMHMTVYRNRPEVGGVVHAHPPTATGFATAGLGLEKCVHPEMIIVLGGVPLAPYALPSSQDLGDSFLPWLPTHDAFLLANHGAIAIGSDVFNALFKMEAIEQFAKISLTARMLGGENELSPVQVRELEGLRAKFGLRVNAHCTGPECPQCHPAPAEPAAADPSLASLQAEVARRLAQRS